MPETTPLKESLQLLEDKRALTLTVDETGASRDWWSRGRVWRRTYGRLEHPVDDRAGPIMTLVFESNDSEQTPEQALCVVEVFKHCVAVGKATPSACIAEPTLGWLKLSRFPADAALPTLPDVLLQTAGVRVVRYRPGRRCTLRSWHAASGARSFVKVFPNQHGAVVHRDCQRLHDACVSGEFDFNVAPPLRWDAVNRALWQGLVPGQPITEKLYGPLGERLALHMGQAAAHIPISSLRSEAIFDSSAQLERSARYARRLVVAAPGLAGRLDELMSALKRAHASADGRRRPIHGSLHAHQWLVDDERLGLVDFDRFSLGDPELDAATLVAELDYENPKRVAVSALTEAFLDGYQSVAGRLNRRLFQAYRAHKHLSKAVKAACALRPDGVQRAERNLDSALQHARATVSAGTMFSF